MVFIFLVKSFQILIQMLLDHTLETTSRPTHLKPIPKSIIIQPTTFSSHPGDIVVLACHNVFNNNASIAWKKDNHPQLPGHIITRNGILIIKSAIIEDSGRYRCESTGENGVISDAADVYITRTNPMKPIEIEETEASTGAPITASISTDLHAMPSIVTETVYPPASDRKPQIMISPNSSEITVYQGDQLQLNCSAEGFRVQWERISGEIVESSYSSENVATIKKSNVKNIDGGLYYCTIKSKNVIIQEKSIMVSIRAKPPSEYRVRLGDQVRIPCEIESQYVEWKRQDGRPLPTTSNYPSRDLVGQFKK